MVPYLAFFAAGDFTSAAGRADGQPWLVAVSDRLPRRPRAASMTMLKRTPALVRWLSQELGAYPFDTTGGLVTSLTPGFALENQTRPTYRRWSPGATWLLVHELAHQWFGDDVAVRQLARHLAQRGVRDLPGAAVRRDPRRPAGGPVAAAAVRQHRCGERLLGAVDRRPRARVDSSTTPVYERGAMTLQALRNRIGDADFRRAAADLGRRQRGGGNGSTAQFRALAEPVSGEDLDGFFDAWLVATTKPADTAANGLG